jgi:hypothetical protein
MNLRWPTMVLLSLLASGLMAVEVDEEHLGDGLFAQSAVWQEGTLHLTTVENMRFGHGQGENFTHWRRNDGEKPWRKQPLFPDHNPGMTCMMPLGADSNLFLYVDRKDENNRRVFLARVDGGRQRVLFEFSGGRGVLNPQMDLLADGRLHLLIPDRTGLQVRRLLVDAQTGDSQRLPDVVMPRAGARIYGRLVDGNRLIVPVSVIHEMLVLTIDLDDHRVALHSIDRFTSASGEPPRMTSIFPLADSGHYALVYLRPAAFSDRVGKQGPATGLLGEIVVNVVDAKTFASIGKTVIAGLQSEAAATHNLDALQTGPREFLLAHTEVKRIHQRHLTGAYENYVGGFLTHWTIDAQGRPVRKAEHRLPPFFSTRLTPLGEGSAALVCNEARLGDPLHLYRIRLDASQPVQPE